MIKKHKIIWITGLSGAGKSTLAKEIVVRLRAHGNQVVLLDGDDLREIFGATNLNSDDFSRAARVKLALKYSYLCRLLSNQGLIVVIATISLFSEVNLWNRKNLNGYYEVYIKVPIEELRRRDQKGIYSRFERGEIKDVSGLDLIIDEPCEPDLLLLYNESQSAVILADELMRKLDI